MSWSHLIIFLVLGTVASLLAPLEQRNYVRKALRRMRDKGLRVEDLRPKPRNWYRIRAGSLAFVLIIASYPVVRRLFPDLHVDSVLDAAVLVGLVLLCSVFVGLEIGGSWQKNADAAYREAKGVERDGSQAE